MSKSVNLKLDHKVGPNLIFHLEGTPQELWEDLALIQEVFATTECVWRGKRSSDIRFVVRENAKKQKFYELHYCGNDPHFYGCRKAFGVNQEGDGMFPRRKYPSGHAKEGQYLPGDGWFKYDRDKECEVYDE